MSSKTSKARYSVFSQSGLHIKMGQKRKRKLLHVGVGKESIERDNNYKHMATCWHTQPHQTNTPGHKKSDKYQQ